ncbi:hypothetical protein BGZ59_002692, partial [Podila verticillata]
PDFLRHGSSLYSLSLTVNLALYNGLHNKPWHPAKHSELVKLRPALELREPIEDLVQMDDHHGAQENDPTHEPSLHLQPYVNLCLIHHYFRRLQLELRLEGSTPPPEWMGGGGPGRREHHIYPVQLKPRPDAVLEQIKTLKRKQRQEGATQRQVKAARSDWLMLEIHGYWHISGPVLAMMLGHVFRNLETVEEFKCEGFKTED